MYSLALIMSVVSEKKAFEHFPIEAHLSLYHSQGNSSTDSIQGVLVFNAIFSLVDNEGGRTHDTFSFFQHPPDCTDVFGNGIERER